MEQKTLLPVVVVVLIGGLLIGYYFGKAGSVQTAPSSAPPSEAALLNTALEDSFVVSAVYVESVVGFVQSVNRDSITITRVGKTTTLPLVKNNTVTMILASGKRIAEPLAFVKPKDYVTIRTLSNADTKKLIGTSITVLKKAA